MIIQFWGAAQTVTGSMHLLEVGGHRLLLDCGLFQGRRKEAFERNRQLPFDASAIDAVVLSHAHIDHSGNLPSLVKSGFQGHIYSTSATRDLCAYMLADSAHIQPQARVELQGVSAGSDLAGTKRYTYFLPELVDEEHTSAATVRHTRDLAQGLAHETGLEPNLLVAHVPLKLHERHERCHGGSGIVRGGGGRMRLLVAQRPGRGEETGVAGLPYSGWLPTGPESA